MPQEFYVLKCFSCETFQVHIVKKAKKWECKMCGTKQSLKRHYGKGSSKDCRNHVMKLNELRLTKSNSSNQMKNKIFEETDWTDDLTEQQLVKEEKKEQKPSISKWAEYVEESITDTESEGEENEANLILNFVDKKKKRMKKRVEHYKNKKFCRKSSESETITTVFEETNELCSNLNNDNIFECFNDNEENNESKCILLKNEPKFGKYVNYLEDEESNENEENEENMKKMKKSKSKWIQSQSEPNFGKYSKYLEDEENNESEENENEENNESKFIQSQSEPKFDKYAKYLEDEKDNNDSPKKVNKSNIFESDINDLDDILSF